MEDDERFNPIPLLPHNWIFGFFCSLLNLDYTYRAIFMVFSS